MPKKDTPKDAELEQTLAYIVSFIDKIDAKEKVEIAPAETDKPMIVTNLYGKTLPDGLDGAREAFVEVDHEHLARLFWARRRWFVWLAREWRNMPEERRDSKSMLALIGRIPRPVMEWLIIIAGISVNAVSGISRFEDGFEKCFGERPDIHEYKKVARALGFDAETAQRGDFTLADIVEHLDGMLLARKAADGAGQRDADQTDQDGGGGPREPSNWQWANLPESLVKLANMLIAAKGEEVESWVILNNLKREPSGIITDHKEKWGKWIDKHIGRKHRAYWWKGQFTS